MAAFARVGVAVMIVCHAGGNVKRLKRFAWVDDFAFAAIDPDIIQALRAKQS